MVDRLVERFSGPAAMLVGVGGFAYSVFFVVFLQSGSRAAATVTHIALLVGGILAIGVVVAVYERVRTVDPSVAMLALLFGVIGAAGSAVHGGYDLANRIHPPAVLSADLPNAADPRGLLTFVFSGLAVLLFGWLIVRSGELPPRLGQLGMVSGVLLVLVYLGRLIVLNPKNWAVLTAASLSGFVLNPGFFLWLGASLRRRPSAA